MYDIGVHVKGIVIFAHGTQNPRVTGLKIGYFGASTVLVAAVLV
jgi:hypothetical protein